MNNQINQTFTSNIIDLLEIQRSSFYNFLFHGIYKELNSLIINPFFLYIPEQRPYINTVLKELHFQKEDLPIKQKIKENNLNFLFSKDLNDSQSSYLEQKNYLIENESQVITADIYIYPAKIKIKGPLRSLSSCVELEETYATSIYLQGKIIQKFQIKEFIPNIYKTRKQKNLFSWTKKGVLNLKLSSNLKSFQNSKISIKKYFYLATIPFLTEDGSFFINGCERVVINQIIRSPGIYFRKEYLNSQKTNYTATFISDNWT
jgi:DNA-directed RNA polymerase beta subunit